MELITPEQQQAMTAGMRAVREVFKKAKEEKLLDEINASGEILEIKAKDGLAETKLVYKLPICKTVEFVADEELRERESSDLTEYVKFVSGIIGESNWLNFI